MPLFLFFVMPKIISFSSCLRTADSMWDVTGDCQDYVTPVAGTHFKLRFFTAVQSRFSESRLFEVPCRLSLYLKGVLCVSNDSDGFDFFSPV